MSLAIQTSQPDPRRKWRKHILTTSDIVVRKNTKYINLTGTNYVLNLFSLNIRDSFSIANNGDGSIRLTNERFIRNNSAYPFFLLDSANTCAELVKVGSPPTGIHQSSDCGSAILVGEWHSDDIIITASHIANKQLNLSNTPINPSIIFMDIYRGPSLFAVTDFQLIGSSISWLGFPLAGSLMEGDFIRLRYQK